MGVGMKEKSMGWLEGTSSNSNDNDDGKKSRVGNGMKKGCMIGVVTAGAILFLFTQMWSHFNSYLIWSQPQPPLSIPGSHNKNIVDMYINKTKSCKGMYELVLGEGVKTCLKESQMLKEASQQGSNTSYLNPMRIAFLFLVRGKIPHEPLWKRFFNNTNTSSHFSIYVHAKSGFKFSSNSIFWHKEITPSGPVNRFSITIVDAMRRLLAHALLDKGANNAWFVFVCESTIPIRSFPYVYNYLMSSNMSYLQSFQPSSRPYLGWETLPEFRKNQLRKGELWMALNRKHATMVVSESKLYQKFKRKCKNSVDGVIKCTPDEQYIQTLLSLQDSLGITRKTIMYVDWSNHHQESQSSLISGSPFSYTRSDISPRLIQNIQRQGRLSKFGSRSHPCDKIKNSMPYNSKQNHNKYNMAKRPLPHCFLFARKFSKDATLRLQKLPKGILGY